ncbi:MAG: hypothetical protein M1828_001766 [Chrysothrix sp. TS-e1954]|nr:MAG: hypothetical protein M1828_001766 [Chrysothrix sp. TS-e1954]
MKSTIAFLSTCASGVYAFPASQAAAAADPRFTNWQAPGPNDVRSPCPGLNTLANHGFIPHNGKNNTLPVLIEGLKAGMNMGVDFSTAIGGGGILSSPNPLGGAFDLNDLDEHNFPIEHDGSLSRQDAYFGNDYSFYQANWDMVLSHYKGMDYTSIPVASKAKYARVRNSQTTNPTFTYGPRETIFSYGETALYIQSMSDAYSGKAKLEYVRSLFEQEKLPYAQGWRPSPEEITLATLGQMAVELMAANPNALEEGVTITSNSLKDVWEGKDPILGILANETGCLTGAGSC